MQKFVWIINIILFSFSLLSAQSKSTVSGFVYDESTGEALIGANVFIEGTQLGASTNIMGFYSIPKLNPGQYQLNCQYIGYDNITQKLNILPGTSKEIIFKLKTNALFTEEVAVVADSVRTSVKLYEKPISKITMSPKQIQSIPQIVEADLLRSLQTMPGIASVSDFSSELYVRGGTPDQNLYMIDGADVYNPEHLFGLFSTFNTDAIKNVEISKGGFGAEYGGRLSSVLDVTNLDGNRREYTSKTSISILSAKTTMQTPLGDYGALSGSIRRTYFDKTIAKLDAFKDKNIPDYYFYDGHLKAYFDLGRNDKLTISGYKGSDNMDFNLDKDNPNAESVLYNWGNTTASVRWTHVFSPQIFGNFWVTGSNFDSEFTMGEEFSEVNNIQDRSVKGNLEYYYSSNLNFKTGFEVKYLKGKYYESFPGGEADVNQKPTHYSGYLQNIWRPTALTEIQTGIRYNAAHNGSNHLQNVEPRLALKYRITDTINLKAAAGQYHQYLFKIPRFFISDIWTTTDENQKDSMSNHFILGFQKEVRKNYQLEVETYYKTYENIYAFDPFFWVDMAPGEYNEKGEPVYNNTKGLFKNGKGHSYGLELLLRKDMGPVTGWISYTLGHTENKIYGMNNDESFVPRHDRTSTLNVVSNIDLKNTIRAFQGKNYNDDKSKWKFGLGFTYATGQPITTTSSVYVANPLPDQNFYDGYSLYPTSRNNFRLPPYIRLDVSMTYSKKFKSFTLEPFLQVFNATNRQNVWFIKYNDRIEGNSIVQDIETQGMLPVLPSFGVNILF